MLDTIKAAADTLNSLSPLAVIAGLAYVIFMLVRTRGELKADNVTITENHLHELPAMAESLRRIEAQLSNISITLGYLRGRLNGGDD
jgi:hypothetical protein